MGVSISALQKKTPVTTLYNGQTLEWLVVLVVNVLDKNSSNSGDRKSVV